MPQLHRGDDALGATVCRVAKAFNYDETVDGLVAFAPVLGNKHVSVLREYHDYSRVPRSWRMKSAPRASTTARLQQLEQAWLSPHPPLHLLDSRLLWIGTSEGLFVHDRHAVMPRRFADVYFRRFEP